MASYVVCIYSHIDIDTLCYEEREELEEIIDDEITEGQSQIEYWCNDNNCDYDLLENHRCIIETNSIYADENISGAIRSIEDNTLNETYITLEEIEE